MDKELLEKWVVDKKKYISDCLTKIQEMLAENDFSGVKCYTQFVEQAAIEATTYELMVEIFG